MSHLAPGRNHDMQRLLDRRDTKRKYSTEWNKLCIRIEDLIWEGKDPVLCTLRERLIMAARAGDHDSQINISKQIDKQVKIRPRPPWLGRE